VGAGLRLEPTMPTTERSGLAIHYEVEGRGLPLVLLHGGYTSSELWRLRGWVESLREERRLILVDLRGHGLSDKPHDPAAYRFSVLAADVLAVLDDLGIASAAVCGFSLGAEAALRLAATDPDRVDAVAAIGSDPASVGFADLAPEQAGGDAQAQRFEREGMGWLAAKLEAEGRPDAARLMAQADPLAMAAWLRAWGEDAPLPLRFTDLAAPSLFAWGEREVEGWDLPVLPSGARLVIVPGADHPGVLERRDVMLPELRALLASARSATA
jgi:pimeloyl-ACP methyl ester carboxylesterase